MGVARLSATDYRAVIEFLYEAGEVDGPEAFPEPLRRSLALLVRADNVWHWTIRDGRKEFRWGIGTGAVAGSFPAQIVAQFDGIDWDEDPMPPVPPFLNRPLRRSDLVAQRAWRRTGIWAGIDRPLGAADWARVWIGSPQALVARFEFDNCRTEWDDRVLSVLGLLTPHLGQLLRRAAVRAAGGGHASGLTPRELEILALVADGRTNGELARMLWISPNTVRKHLENAFDKLGVHTRAAAVARAFGARSVLSG